MSANVLNLPVANTVVRIDPDSHGLNAPWTQLPVAPNQPLCDCLDCEGQTPARGLIRHYEAGLGLPRQDTTPRRDIASGFVFLSSAEPRPIASNEAHNG
jgi:hypothetical protein